MREVEEKLQALAEQIRTLSKIVEESRRGSDLPLVLTYKRAARELDISVDTLKRMIARGQIRPVSRGEGFDPGIARSSILRLVEQSESPHQNSRQHTARAAAPKGGSVSERVRAARLAAKAKAKGH